MIRGSVDVVTATEMRGWAYSPERNEPVQLQALLNQEILGEATANIYRPDLAAAGLGDGNSGFAIKLFRPIDPLYLPFLVVKVNGGDVELPKAPTLGFKEFFDSLYMAHPTAGRQRSVLGGLWINRTDAPALLRGKVEIGQISDEIAADIQELIHTGITAIDLSVPLEQPISRDSINDQVGRLFKNPNLVSVLEAVLEDRPAIVQADLAEGIVTKFTQPSAKAICPSPAESLEVVVSVENNVVVESIRDSHQLPEFTSHGQSRWTNGATIEIDDLVSSTGLLDLHELSPGTAMIVGPGTIYRIRCDPGSTALISMCLPTRGLSVAMAIRASQKEEVHENGVRVWA